MLDNLICDIEEFLMGMFLHGISDLRNEEVDAFDKMIMKLEDFCMDGYQNELKKYGSLMRKSINSKEDNQNELMEQYFLLCGYTFIIKDQ